MTCRHTGADIYLDSHHAVAHCDIHSIGNVAVFRISQIMHGVGYDPARHYRVRAWSSMQWHDQQREDGVSTLIVLQSSMVVPDKDRDRWV